MPSANRRPPRGRLLSPRSSTLSSAAGPGAAGDLSPRSLANASGPPAAITRTSACSISPSSVTVHPPGSRSSARTPARGAHASPRFAPHERRARPPAIASRPADSGRLEEADLELGGGHVGAESVVVSDERRHPHQRRRACPGALRAKAPPQPLADGQLAELLRPAARDGDQPARQRQGPAREAASPCRRARRPSGARSGSTGEGRSPSRAARASPARPRRGREDPG